MPIFDRLLLRKGLIIETLFDRLRSDMGLEHTGHRKTALIHNSCIIANL